MNGAYVPAGPTTSLPDDVLLAMLREVGLSTGTQLREQSAAVGQRWGQLHRPTISFVRARRSSACMPLSQLNPSAPCSWMASPQTAVQSRVPSLAAERASAESSVFAARNVTDWASSNEM